MGHRGTLDMAWSEMLL